MSTASNPRRMMGFETPLDQKVTISVRDWNALKLAIWRSKVGWEIAARAATEIVDRCRHAEGCAGAASDTEPCLRDRYEILTSDAGEQTRGKLLSHGCPDREQRMSALVVLNATRMLSPIDARQPANEPYISPTRERYCETIAELAATQAELDMWRAKYASESVEPPPNDHPTLPPPQKYDHQLDEEEETPT